MFCFSSPNSTTVTNDNGAETDNAERLNADADTSETENVVTPNVESDTEKSDDETPVEAEIDLPTYFRLLAKSFCNPGSVLLRKYQFSKF